MRLLQATLVAAGLVAAAPTNSTSGRNCVQLELPLHVVVDNYAINQPRADSTVQVVNWTRDDIDWSAPNITERITGTIHIDQIFKISGQLCVPRDGVKSKTMLLATHGVGFDSR